MRVQDYTVTVDVAGREPVILPGSAGAPTSSPGCWPSGCGRPAAGRPRSWARCCPGSTRWPCATAAGLLRDGVAVPASALDGIHPDLAGTLLQLATLPDRRDAMAGLGRRTELAIGFRQLASVRRPAAGATPWHDHAATPHIGEHESPGGSFGPGLAGVMAAGVMSGGPGAFGFGEGFGAFGGYWAFRALGAGMNARGARPMAPRPDVTRGLLTPATEDLAALTMTGDTPPC